MHRDKPCPLMPFWNQVGNAKQSHSLEGNEKHVPLKSQKQGGKASTGKDNLEALSSSAHRGPRISSATTTNACKFKGKLLGDLIFIEVCAGSARLTKAARDAGFTGIAVDHTTMRSCGIDICIFELEDQQQVDELCSFIKAEADNIAAIWIAPSCGTASKARERRLPQLKSLGIDVPVPLRSADQPDQLDGLQYTNKLKVEKANLLYDAIEQITTTACLEQIFVGIENPGNSHYWGTTPMQKIIADFGDKFVTFHNCCHGGFRDKLTSVWVNDNWLDSLEARCDGSHTHKSWRVTISKRKVHFPTSEEAAYPLVLCQRIVECVKQKVLSLGAVFSETLAEQLEQPDAAVAGRISLGALPRGSKLKPLVAEFGTFIDAVSPSQQSHEVDHFIKTLPKGSKLVSRQLVTRGDVRVVQNSSTHFLGGSENLDVHEMVERCWIGVPSEPQEFVRRAVTAGHPRGLDIHVDDSMRNVVHQNVVAPPYILAKKRVDYLKKWMAKARELEPEEEKLRASMPEHVRQVLGRKRLVLFKSMLDELGYPDTTLVDDIAAGFRLSGYMTKSGVFRPKSKRPSMSLSTLKKLSRAFNQKVMESMLKRQDDELEEATWRETENEVSKGWIFFDESNSTEGKFIGRRFGLKQGPKIRVIDDCTCCGLNLTVGLHEKFKLHSVDFLAALFCFALKLCKGSQGPQLRGRTYDLKSAYKQFAVHPLDRGALRMGVNKPGTDSVSVIGFNSLPFGAIGSVAGFLRISQALWFLGYYGLGLLWTAFYDDYTLLSRPELEQSSSWSCESLLNLLGMQFATEGHKCLPFDTTFKTLGIQVNTENFVNGEVLIGHTDSRKEELQGHIKDLLQNSEMSSKEAERLRGRMIFFEGYTFGRIANSAVKALGRFCNGPSKRQSLDESMKRTLSFLGDRVLTGRPLTIERALDSTWFIFTDGACNPDEKLGSIGGLLYSPQGDCVHFFGGKVPSAIMDDLLSRPANPIHELEVLPVLVAAALWGHLVARSQTVFYIDNESSRMAYIRGDGETLRSKSMIESFVDLEARLQLRIWFGRVPSYSNPADSPSRLCNDEVLSLGATETNIDWEQVKSHLGL